MRARFWSWLSRVLDDWSTRAGTRAILARMPAKPLPIQQGSLRWGPPGLPPDYVPTPLLPLPLGACCGRVYWCPTVESLECPVHGGFDVCCSRPDLHVI